MDTISMAADAVLLLNLTAYDAAELTSMTGKRREINYLRNKLGGDPLPPAPAKNCDKTLTWRQRRKADKEAYKAYLEGLEPDDRAEAIARKRNHRISTGIISGGIATSLGVAAIIFAKTR